MPRYLGQHFLHSGSVIQKIVTSLDLHADERVLEIGPGRGALTMPLLRKAARLLLIEKDEVLAEALKRKLSAESNVTILPGDFLRTAWEDIEAVLGKAFKVVSNLPYEVSTAILTRLLNHAAPGTLLILMFQKEVADRLLAGPGSKTYGSLSVFVQMVARVKHLVDVSPGSFKPPPKVDSSVLRFTLKEEAPVPRARWEAFEALLHAGFRQRRKMLRQNLRSYFAGSGAEDVEARLAAVGADPRARAEQLSLEQWLRLFGA